MATREEVLHNGPAEQRRKPGSRSRHHAGVEPRIVFVAVDLGRDNTVQVVPADYEPDGNIARVDTCKQSQPWSVFPVLGRTHPRYCCWSTKSCSQWQVDAHRAQDDAGVTCTGGLTTQQNGEINDAEKETDVANPIDGCGLPSIQSSGSQSSRQRTGCVKQLTLDPAVACRMSVQASLYGIHSYDKVSWHHPQAY